jgi:hypothetical protein
LVVQASEPSPLQRSWISVHSACALCKNYSSAAAELPGTASPLLRCARLRAGAVRPKSFVMSAGSSCQALYEAEPRVNPMWSLTPRSTPTRYGRRCKPGLRYFVLCSQPRLTAPTSAGGVTSNVRLHKTSGRAARCRNTNAPCYFVSPRERESNAKPAQAAVQHELSAQEQSSASP